MTITVDDIVGLSCQTFPLRNLFGLQTYTCSLAKLLTKKRERKGDSLELEILETMERIPRTRTFVADSLHQPQRTVDYRLAKLAENGLVTKARNKHKVLYSVTGYGRARQKILERKHKKRSERMTAQEQAKRLRLPYVEWLKGDSPKSIGQLVVSVPQEMSHRLWYRLEKHGAREDLESIMRQYLERFCYESLPHRPSKELQPFEEVAS